MIYINQLSLPIFFATGTIYGWFITIEKISSREFSNKFITETYLHAPVISILEASLNGTILFSLYIFTYVREIVSKFNQAK